MIDQRCETANFIPVEEEIPSSPTDRSDFEYHSSVGLKIALLRTLIALGESEFTPWLDGNDDAFLLSFGLKKEPQICPECLIRPPLIANFKCSHPKS